MSNELLGRTFLVTGASRGIGKAISVRLASSGANIIVCGRSMDSNPNFPGTLLETVSEIESVGGKGHAVLVDIRNDEQISQAINEGVEKFGGIDGVVCNAGALFIAPFEATPMKRFDLVHQVNIRGTYSTIQAALPHLKNSEFPHILTISPPISLESKWLAGTTAYTISKYSMSLLVSGLSVEFMREGIGVNALWPATTIDTAAVRFNQALGGAEMARRSRKPEIVGDAAFHILTQNPKKYTGNFLTDEQALAEAGITELDHYSVEPGQNLQPDFYL
jgi:citronellol/citronellal dehydrogenase